MNALIGWGLIGSVTVVMLYLFYRVCGAEALAAVLGGAILGGLLGLGIALVGGAL
jgi:hypothetical protein